MPRSPDLDSLRLLVLVADHGSIGAAARAARVSQPTASNRLAALERSLGVALLTRSSAGSRLTDAGRLVAEWGAEVLRSMDELLHGVEALRTEDSPQLSVAASQTVAEFLVPRWLTALRADQPDAQVRLRVANSADVVDLVRRGEAEVGFIETPHRPRDLHSVVLGHDELVLVAPAGTPHRPHDATTLRALPLVTREPGSGTRDTLEQAIGRLGPEVRVASSNSQVKLAVMSGAGHAVLSRLAVGAEITDGRLVRLPTEGLDLRRPLRALVRRDAPPSALRERLVAIAHTSQQEGAG